jgi:membrane-associated phospholipid phosphatase
MSSTRPEGGRSAADPPSRAALLAWSLLLLLVTADVVLRGPLSRLDQGLADWLRAHLDLRKLHHLGRHQKGEIALVALLQFGAPAVYAVVVPYLVVVSARRRTLRPLVRLAVLGVLLVSVVYAAKLGFGRTQPVQDEFWTSEGRSYPSGHTANATVTWGLVAWVTAEYGPPALRRVTGVLRWLAPLLTAAAMVLLVYHWLTDVIAGAAVGVLLLALLHTLDRWALAHWPDAYGGISGGGRRAADRGRAGSLGDGRPVHDPGPADR